MNKQKILIVDDLIENLRLLVSIFNSHDYELLLAKNGHDALTAACESKPDIILLDINIPGKNGYEVCTELKASPRTKNIPVIFLTASTGIDNESKGLALGAVDYISKPYSTEIILARVKNHLQLKQYQDHLQELVQQGIRKQENIQRVTIEALAILAEYRDNETGGHIKRTRSYVRLLAQKLQNHDHFKSYLSNENIKLLYTSAPLHDIGKVGIQDSILLKPGPLTDDEMEIMKKHAYYGYQTLNDAEKKLDGESFLTIAKEMAYTHHERYDGQGYPRGLCGEDIPIPGRLMAVADVYDALISQRIYKKPMSHSKAVSIIVSERGKAFDPDVTDCFAAESESFRQIAIKYADHPSELDALNK